MHLALAIDNMCSVAVIFAALIVKGYAESSGTVRGTGNRPRSNVLRRIYGPENASVRAEIHKLETESTHYRRTGVLSDPSHEVDYDLSVHPLHNRRSLQEMTETERENYFEPMRITFFTDALDSLRTQENGAKIDFVKNIVLPRTKKFWSEALSVVPVGSKDGNPLKISSGELVSRVFCGDSEFSRVPSEHITNGVADTDVILYVSAAPSSRFCGPSTLAVAVACNFDQFDRPTAGAINFCLDQIKLNSDGTAHPSIIEDNVDVAIHEAAHVFGMSSNSYRFFWDPDAILPKPRTPRPFSAVTVQCVDGVTRTMSMPNENTLQILTAENGQRYATIVTPKVRTVVRNHFNCQDLEGAQLENQPTGSNSCTGDHWDERQFYPESLSGVISPTTVTLSPVTLALFEDSGWYSANYTKAQIMPWGHGAGCDFVRKPCLIKDQSTGATSIPDYGLGYFCTDANQRGCSPSHYYKMGCTLLDYDVFINSPNPPPQFQYFSQPSLGGLIQADYCPVYGSSYRANAHDLDCRDPNNGAVVDFYGEDYGEDSTCFESSTATGRSGRCYRSFCNLELRKLQVWVNDKWETCESDFQEIRIRADPLAATLASSITCPKITSVCPDMFCPVNCAGRGICNWENRDENGTIVPKCECFDPSDTTPACAESLPLDGKYIRDESVLDNTIGQKFFEPLVAVFTDNPNTWERDSWIWASALLVLFLLLMFCVCSSFCSKKGKQGRRIPRSDDYYDAPRRGQRPLRGGRY
mmetsp:Transcript_7887/g.14864  ORF Transcript_7887/g.14864 Transcript_7887/m.14864 type:complete len:754 (+) Transcript_7887:177-2438(+)